VLTLYDRMCAPSLPPGTELLRVEMPFLALGPKDHKKTLGMLPQAPLPQAQNPTS